jgi:hypothetical protein
MFDRGSWRSSEDLVVTGTDRRAIKKKVPNIARMALAHGPDDALSDKIRLP